VPLLAASHCCKLCAKWPQNARKLRPNCTQTAHKLHTLCAVHTVSLERGEQTILLARCFPLPPMLITTIIIMIIIMMIEIFPQTPTLRAAQIHCHPKCHWRSIVLVGRHSTWRVRSLCVWREKTTLRRGKEKKRSFWLENDQVSLFSETFA